MRSEGRLRAIPASHDDVVFVVAVSRELTERARLAGQIPAESVLLILPDYPAAPGAAAAGTAEARPGAAGTAGTAGTVTTWGGLTVDRLCQQVTWNGSPLPLTRLERGLLACLAEPPIRVWPHEHLHSAVWQEAWLGDTASLHATVKRLRRKLRDAGVAGRLEAVRGVGFRLLIEDSPGTGEAPAPAPAPSAASGAAGPPAPAVPACPPPPLTAWAG